MALTSERRRQATEHWNCSCKSEGKVALALLTALALHACQQHEPTVAVSTRALAAAAEDASPAATAVIAHPTSTCDHGTTACGKDVNKSGSKAWRPSGGPRPRDNEREATFIEISKPSDQG